MFRPLITRLGVLKSTLLMSILSVLLSFLVYLAIAFASGTFRPVGVIISLITPALVAPPVCIALLRLAFSLFHTRQELLAVQGDLEERVKRRTVELEGMNGQLRAEIQERRQVEQDLRESEARYRLLAENMADVVWTMDPETLRFTYVSPSVGKLTGFTPEEVTGQALAKVLTPESFRVAGERLAYHLRSYSPGHAAELLHPFQVDVCRKDGVVVPVEVVTTLLTNDRGDTLLLGVTRDVTERKKVEQDLMKSKEEYRSIFEQTVIGIFRSTDRGRYLDANPAMAKIYGYESAEELIDTVRDIKTEIYVDPGERSRVLEQIQQSGYIEGYETEHRRKDGGIIWISTTLRPVRDEGGKTAYYYGTVQEITGRKTAEMELKRYQERLEELVRERTTELEEKNAQLEREIAERVRSESELRKLSLAIEASRATVVIADREGTIEYANPAFSRVTGYTVEEAVGQNPRVLKSGVHSKEFYEEMWATILGGEVWEGQLCNKKKDGQLYWESVSISPVRNREGEIAHFVAVKEDITEKRRLDEALKHQYAFLQTVIDAIPSPIFFKDAEGLYLGCNTSFERYLGRSREEIVGKSVYGLSPKELADIYDVKDRELFSRGGVQVYEAKVADKDSNVPRDVMFYKATFSNVDGTLGGLVGVILDITERKRIEEALRESELKSRTILEAVFTGIVVVDPETHTIVDINTVAEKMIGRPREEIVGKQCYDICVANEGECPITDKGQTIDRCERALIGSNGREMPIIKTVVPVTLGGRTHLLESFVDITELKQMERNLMEAKLAADAANRAKSSFLASMSHEIRTPMNAILGFSQLMLRGPALNPQQKQHLDTINRSGEHLLTLINDILEMSKIEAGRTTVNPLTFDLTALVDDVGEMFRLRAAGKNLQFSIEWTNEVPRFVVVDESKLRQVLINLLGNAVKFTDQGGVAVRIGVMETDVSQVNLKVEVEDTGPGIPDEERDKLFRPFQQTGIGVRAGGGTGLGLAISREFVRLMGGDITVKSVVGKGSIFGFRIPLAEGAAEAVRKKSEGRRVHCLQPGQVPPRILIADDNEDNRALVGSLLGHVGFEVQKASDGRDAVEKFSEWRPHLILMDVRMPVMDGYEAIRRIREAPGGQGVNIITMTASAFSPSREEALRAGADAFMAKPFRETELLEKIAQLLGVRYVYEDESEPASPLSEELTAAAAETPAAIPESLIELIREAAIDGDFDRVIELTAEVEAFDALLALGFRRLAERFDSQRLLEIVDGKEAGIGLKTGERG